MTSEFNLDEPHPIFPWLDATKRRTIQAALPVIALLATVYGVASESTAALWVNLAAALLSTGVALPNVPNAAPWRKYLYGLLLATAAFATGIGVTDAPTAALWVTLATVVLSGGVAFPNTTDAPQEG